MWTFRGYISHRNEEELPVWFEGLTPEDQAAVLTALEQLARVERDYWRRPQFDVLHGRLAGMGEIILGKIDGVQTRLVGFFGPGRVRHTFTGVLVVTKKMNVYSPKDWEETCIRRRDECETDEARTHAWYP